MIGSNDFSCPLSRLLALAKHLIVLRGPMKSDGVARRERVRVRGLKKNPLIRRGYGSQARQALAAFSRLATPSDFIGPRNTIRCYAKASKREKGLWESAGGN